MPSVPVPAFLRKAAVRRAIALLMLVYENWDKVKVVLQPALDRALRVLVSNAESQGVLTAEEAIRLRELEQHRRRKAEGGDGRRGWNFDERLEVVALLEKAYRDNPRAKAVLSLLEKRLARLRTSGPAARREEFVDGVAVEDGPADDEVTISRAEYERLRRLAGS